MSADYNRYRSIYGILIDWYEELKQSYIIFICLENPYSKCGLHKYTFLSQCQELKGLYLADEATKILLSAEGDADDVSVEMRAFLKYLVTRKADSDFTKRIEDKVEHARQHREWRDEYMTLYEKFEEMREEGREEERINTELERKRADAAEARADAAEARADAAEERLKQMEKQLAAYQADNRS